LRLVVTGGGTGGHVYPALAVARAIVRLRPGTEVLYLGTLDGLEAGIVPREGFCFEAVPSRGMVGKGLAGLPSAGLTVLRGVRAAGRIIRRFRPDVVLGTGGYVTGPVAVAARLTGVPLVLHEGNAFPGLTNRIAARWAAAVTVPFEQARRHFPRRAKVFVTGNPIREEILATTPEEGRRVLGLPAAAKVVYLVGGSRGARVLNEAVVAALPDWLAELDVWAVFVTGQRYYDEVMTALDKAGIRAGAPGKVIAVPYLHRADAALAAADVVVTRAGGTTLAEVTARGIPAVVIPSPNVTFNHQEYNARVLERAGAAKVILEKDLNGPALSRVVRRLLTDPELRDRMHRASLKLGRPKAAEAIARVVISAAEGRPIVP